ncbi:MAG: TIM barrel protein [Clostridiales bacterium]|nr:TIM barrel protein [Clostridiales bacterium]
MFTLTVHNSWFRCDEYDKPEAAARRGFKAIEMLNWTGLDTARMRAALEDAGVALSAILCRSKDPAIQEKIDNRHGIVHADALDAFVTAIGETIAAARSLGTKIIVVTTGNEIPEIPRSRQHDQVVAALRAAAPLAEEAGMMLALEPLNVLVNHKGYYLTTTAEAVEMIREVGSPSVRVLYDVYHQQITEGNLISTIRDNIEYIGHIHVGDVPGRKQPGTGEINYRNVFRAIRDTGYDGFVVFECGLTEDVDVVCPKMWALLEDE